MKLLNEIPNSEIGAISTDKIKVKKIMHLDKQNNEDPALSNNNQPKSEFMRIPPNFIDQFQ